MMDCRDSKGNPGLSMNKALRSFPLGNFSLLWGAAAAAAAVVVLALGRLGVPALVAKGGGRVPLSIGVEGVWNEIQG